MATKEIKAKDMTTREMLLAIVGGKFEAASSSGQTVQERAQAMLDAIDKRNAANKEKPKKSAPKVDNTEIKNIILEFLSDKEESLTAKVISEGTEVEVHKATAVLRQMIEDGTIERVDLGRSKPLEYRKA